MFAAIVLAQVLSPTPQPIVTPTQRVATSERDALQQVADDGVARARALGGQLGVVVIDLGTGTTASRNADQSLPTQSVQKLTIAAMIYDRMSRGEQPDDVATRDLLDAAIEHSDNGAAKTLLGELGGVEKANVRLVNWGYTGIVLGADDNGFATPRELARFLSAIQDGTLLHGRWRARLLDELGKATTFPGRLRAGFPKGTLVQHKTGTSRTEGGLTEATNDIGLISLRDRTVIVVTMLHDAKGDEKSRDAVISNVARGVYDATTEFPI